MAFYYGFTIYGFTIYRLRFTICHIRFTISEALVPHFLPQKREEIQELPPFRNDI